MTHERQHAQEEHLRPETVAAPCSTSRTAQRPEVGHHASTRRRRPGTRAAARAPRSTGTSTSVHSRSRQVAGSVSSHLQRCSRPISPLVSSTGRGRYGVAIVTPDHSRAQRRCGAGQPPHGQQALRREQDPDPGGQGEQGEQGGDEQQQADQRDHRQDHPANAGQQGQPDQPAGRRRCADSSVPPAPDLSQRLSIMWAGGPHLGGANSTFCDHVSAPITSQPTR